MNISDPQGSTSDVMREDESSLYEAEQSLLRLHTWILGNGWAGFDPYDVEDWHPHSQARRLCKAYMEGNAVRDTLKVISECQENDVHLQEHDKERALYVPLVGAQAGI